MSKTAKLFRNGNSQALRLPQEFRFKGDEVKIRRQGHAVVLEPIIKDTEEWFAAIDRYAGSDAFQGDWRDQRVPAEKTAFEKADDLHAPHQRVRRHSRRQASKRKEAS